jgi:ABC-type branched-subunit amino acid transport system ATPase component
MPEDALLETVGLCTYYGTSQALVDVAIKVPSRGAVAILGRNGAGKTTLLKTLAGDLQPARGTITFDGEDSVRLATEQRVRRGLGHVPQEQGIFGGLSVKENLLIGAMADPKGESRIGEMLELFPRLGQRLSQKAGTLSGGERKMLAIGRGLMSDPELLLVDEPSFGLAPQLTESVFESLNALKKRGMTIMLVEQNVTKALAVTDRGYVLENGRIELEGRSRELACNDHVRKVFLGV